MKKLSKCYGEFAHLSNIHDNFQRACFASRMGKGRKVSPTIDYDHDSLEGTSYYIPAKDNVDIPIGNAFVTLLTHIRSTEWRVRSNCLSVRHRLENKMQTRRGNSI